jgi:hypothetical protein
MSLKAPPLGITCHWIAGAGVPLAEALKSAFAPSITDTFAGSLVTTGMVHVPRMIVLLWAMLLSWYASTVPDVSTAVFSTVPVAFASTATTNPKLAFALAARLPDRTHRTVPVPPTAGVVIVQPAAVVADANVVPAGIASVTVSAFDDSGPLLFTMML